MRTKLMRAKTRRVLANALASAFTVLALALSGCTLAADPPASVSDSVQPTQPGDSSQQGGQAPVGSDEIPAYAGKPVIELNGGEPSFGEEDRALSPFETYAPLDDLGRCGPAFALVGPETMPTEDRGSIGDVKPSGWRLVKYDIVDGAYLYNRCHLIAYQLTGENANERNLITGTRFMNAESMVPFETQVADYIERTGNHVLYRATPVFDGDDLVARGVQLEALSVEDDGSGVSFNVFAYNVQPGVAIDYATGESWLDGTIEGSGDFDASRYDCVLNTNTKRFHLPSCPSVEDMKADNREGFNGAREEALAKGYEPCGRCSP